MEEKAKNLATKEDIEEITAKVEKTKYQYNAELEKLRININKDFQQNMDEMRFLKERSYRQYSQLYSKLYSIIIQSEYIRYFFNIDGNFNDIPFLEIHQKNIESKIDLNNTMLNHTEKEVFDSVTEFNKIKLAELILEKGELASEKLLKLSVAYRYVHQNYLLEDVPEPLNARYKTEELILIRDIVNAIIKETNELKKICNLTYNEKERSTGVMSWEQ